MDTRPRRDTVVPPFERHQAWTISDENHMQVFARLVKAGIVGVHNPPGPRKPKKS